MDLSLSFSSGFAISGLPFQTGCCVQICSFQNLLKMIKKNTGGFGWFVFIFCASDIKNSCDLYIEKVMTLKKLVVTSYYQLMDQPVSSLYNQLYYRI